MERLGQGWPEVAKTVMESALISFRDRRRCCSVSGLRMLPRSGSRVRIPSPAPNSRYSTGSYSDLAVPVAFPPAARNQGGTSRGGTKIESEPRVVGAVDAETRAG